MIIKMKTTLTYFNVSMILLGSKFSYAQVQCCIIEDVTKINTSHGSLTCSLLFQRALFCTSLQKPQTVSWHCLDVSASILVQQTDAGTRSDRSPLRDLFQFCISAKLSVNDNSEVFSK